MLRKFIVSVVLIVTVVGLAVGVSLMLIHRRPSPPRRDAGRRAWLVQTVRVVPQDTMEWIRGYGTAAADTQAVLRAEVNAAVVERVGDIESGDAVRVGQTLIRLDDREFRQDLLEASALLAANQADLDQIGVERRNLLALLEIAQDDRTLNRQELDRVKQLSAVGNAPATELRNARLRYQGSLRAVQAVENQIALLEPRRLRLIAEKRGTEARAERARLDIARCAISAPFSGKIVSIAVDVGDKLRVGGEVLTLLDDSRIEVPIELPVAAMPRVKVGAAAQLAVESIPDIRWRGVVTRVAPQADVQSRTFRAYVEVDNTRQRVPLAPGFFVQARVGGEQFEDAMIAPRAALVNGTMFVARGVVQPLSVFPYEFVSVRAGARPVRVRRTLDDRVVLADGIRPGESVIVSNLDTLYDGALVRIAAQATRPPSGTGLVGRWSDKPVSGADVDGGEGL